MPATLISLSEVIASLSYALDLTEGQDPGHSIRACLIGMRLAEELGLREDERSNLYYALLLKDAGCSVNAAPVARLFGSDDQAVKRALKLTDWSRYLDAAAYGVRNAAIGAPVWKRVAHVLKIGAAGSRGAREMVRIRCERGADIARRLGFPEATALAIHSLDEHWDGSGHPEGLRGDAIPLLSRISLFAQTVDVFRGEAGAEAAIAMARTRRGTWFQPEIVDCFLDWSTDASWWEEAVEAADEAVFAVEPPEHVRHIDDSGLDRVAEAFADVVDAKSPYTYRHSANVARYARHLARTYGCDTAECQRLYRAGLLHDIGKLGISNRILDKQGRLTDDEMAEMRKHPIHSLEVLSRVRAFEDFAWTAAVHHEHLDGNGYAWGIGAARLGPAERILAVADVFEALTARRPYREALTPERALGIMREDSGHHLDRDLVELLSWSARELVEGAAPTLAPTRTLAAS